jgi:hypothetical protein
LHNIHGREATIIIFYFKHKFFFALIIKLSRPPPLKISLWFSTILATCWQAKEFSNFGDTSEVPVDVLVNKIREDVKL